MPEKTIDDLKMLNLLIRRVSLPFPIDSDLISDTFGTTVSFPNINKQLFSFFIYEISSKPNLLTVYTFY